MLNDRIHSMARLQSALAKAEDYLTKLPSDTAYTEFQYELASLLMINVQAYLFFFLSRASTYNVV